MTTLREAAQQALEAMDDLHRTGDTQVFDLCHRETTEALRAALAQEQTLEQEPSNPKEKEMTDPNSVSFNLNTDALPVEWLRLDGTGFHYKGKVIEDAGEAYDLFTEWLAMAHQQLSAQPLTIERLQKALVASRVIPPEAVEDADNYDDGVMIGRIEALFRRIA